MKRNDTANIVLVVDDDSLLREGISMFLGDKGFVAVEAASAEEGFEQLDVIEENVCAVLLDQHLPGMDGIAALRILQNKYSHLPTIFLTADKNIDTAIASMKLGAYDYLTKPVRWESLLLITTRAKKLADLQRENRILSRRLKRIDPEDILVTQNKKLQETIRSVKKISALDSTFLINGDSGVGKELLAKTIHMHSNRHNKPFVAINCASLTDDLMSSSLFGFEKGSFTGAIQSTKGCFEEADGGTLFLDEIGDMSIKMQSSLLRVLQEKEFSRIGNHKPVKTDFRLISATNRNLEDDISDKVFREDLYYRLNVVNIYIAPLRERPEDIPLLTKYFIDIWSEKFQKQVSFVEPAVIEKFLNYPWPGNVRELKNVLEHAVALANSKYIELESISDKIRNYGSATCDSVEVSMSGTIYSQVKKNFQEEYFRWALSEAHGNIAKMATITGISRPNVYRHLKNCGIEIKS